MGGKECKENFLNRVCDWCTAEDYCPCDCPLIEKAKDLTDKQWDDIAKKYDDDIYAISKSIQRRRCSYE